MFRFLLRFLFLILALRILVDVWRRLTGRYPRSPGPDRVPGGRGDARASSRAAAGSQGPVQGRPETRRRMRASLDRDGAVDVPFVEVGGSDPEPAPAPHGADRV